MELLYPKRDEDLCLQLRSNYCSVRPRRDQFQGHRFLSELHEILLMVTEFEIELNDRKGELAEELTPATQTKLYKDINPHSHRSLTVATFFDYLIDSEVTEEEYDAIFLFKRLLPNRDTRVLNQETFFSFFLGYSPLNFEQSPRKGSPEQKYFYDDPMIGDTDYKSIKEHGCLDTDEKDKMSRQAPPNSDSDKEADKENLQMFNNRLYFENTLSASEAESPLKKSLPKRKNRALQSINLNVISLDKNSSLENKDFYVDARFAESRNCNTKEKIALLHKGSEPTFRNICEGHTYNDMSPQNRVESTRSFAQLLVKSNSRARLFHDNDDQFYLQSNEDIYNFPINASRNKDAKALSVSKLKDTIELHKNKERKILGEIKNNAKNSLGPSAKNTPSFKGFSNKTPSSCENSKSLPKKNNISRVVPVSAFIGEVSNEKPKILSEYAFAAMKELTPESKKKERVAVQEGLQSQASTSYKLKFKQSPTYSNCESRSKSNNGRSRSTSMSKKTTQSKGNIVADLLIDLHITEGRLEGYKIALAACHDFNVSNLFDHIDREGNGYITKQEFNKFLMSVGVETERKYFDGFFNQLVDGKPRVNFCSFSKLFYPVSSVQFDIMRKKMYAYASIDSLQMGEMTEQTLRDFFHCLINHMGKIKSFAKGSITRESFLVFLKAINVTNREYFKYADMAELEGLDRFGEDIKKKVFESLDLGFVGKVFERDVQQFLSA